MKLFFGVAIFLLVGCSNKEIIKTKPKFIDATIYSTNEKVNDAQGINKCYLALYRNNIGTMLNLSTIMIDTSVKQHSQAVTFSYVIGNEKLEFEVYGEKNGGITYKEKYNFTMYGDSLVGEISTDWSHLTNEQEKTMIRKVKFYKLKK